MIKKVLFLGLIVTLLSFAMHKYYVSITEADYNTQTETFEISIKFIGHDLEKAMAISGAPELFLGTSKEIEKADDLLLKYIQKRFIMIVDGRVLALKFIGKEINNDDFIYCFLESDKLKTPRKVTVKNTLLIEVFKDQANTVYLKVGNQKINYSLNKSKVSETREIK